MSIDLEKSQVIRASLYSLFAILIILGIMGLNQNQEIVFGNAVYSSKAICTANLDGTCKLSCANGEHSVGAIDCTVRSSSSGGGSGGTSSDVAIRANCGDNVCDGNAGETSRTCPQDCHVGFVAGECGNGVMEEFEVCDKSIIPEVDRTDFGDDLGYFLSPSKLTCTDYFDNPHTYTGDVNCSDTCDAVIISSCEQQSIGNDGGSSSSTSSSSGGGGGGSPIMKKIVSANAVKDITGYASTINKPVCCVPNECYSNNDCPSDKSCSNFECIPNNQKIINHDNAIELSSTVSKYVSTREAYILNYLFSKNGLTYAFNINEVSYDKNRIAIEFAGKTYYLFRGETIKLDLDGDKVDDVQLLSSNIEDDNTADVFVSELQSPDISEETQFFGSQQNLSPYTVAIVVLVILAALVLISRSIKLAKKNLSNKSNSTKKIVTTKKRRKRKA